MRPRIRQLGQVAPPMVVIGAQSSGRDVNDVGVMMSLRRFSKTTKSSMLHTSKRPIDQSLSNNKGTAIPIRRVIGHRAENFKFLKFLDYWKKLYFIYKKFTIFNKKNSFLSRFLAISVFLWWQYRDAALLLKDFWCLFSILLISFLLSRSF